MPYGWTLCSECSFRPPAGKGGNVPGLPSTVGAQSALGPDGAREETVRPQGKRPVPPFFVVSTLAPWCTLSSLGPMQPQGQLCPGSLPDPMWPGDASRSRAEVLARADLPCPFQIVIPFFSLLIKDIYFLHEGHANYFPNGRAYFEVGSSRSAGQAIVHHNVRAGALGSTHPHPP